MKITPHQISVRDLSKGYIDSGEHGVVGFDGKLDIRPPYQREFVYNDAKRAAVIRSVRKGYPINVMYWVDKGNGEYEILDGQQRTISICQYVDRVFAIKDESGQDRYFQNLTPEEQEQILNYEITIYFCEGSDRERLEWFEIINVAGEVLTRQELLNANYTGPWLADAKLKFSKRDCVARKLGNDKGELMKGDPNRQDYLETVIKWINKGDVSGYMAKHQYDQNADELFNYYKNVIRWTRATFKTYYRQMAGLPWGEYYNEFGSGMFDPDKIDAQVKALMADTEVQRKSGIYAYILTGTQSHLNLRSFDASVSTSVYSQQDGICAMCGEKFEQKRMQADHIIPWSKGGKTLPDNCQMLCIDCNLKKSAKSAAA